MDTLMIASARNAAALCATLAMAACAQAPDAEDVAARVISDHEACEYNPAIFLNPAIARQGAAIDIVVQEPVGAFAPRPIPAELLTGWKATPAGQINVARDGSAFTVLPTATPGTDVTVSASFCGQRDITRTIRIVGKDEPVITGYWREETKQCAGETPKSPVNEFEIRDIGEFSITYFPFESYRDFWGKYVFDAKAGTLSMSVDGGNRVPAGAKLSGGARLTPDGKLVLDGFFLWQPENAGGLCTYTFKK